MPAGPLLRRPAQGLLATACQLRAWGWRLRESRRTLTASMHSSLRNDLVAERHYRCFRLAHQSYCAQQHASRRGQTWLGSVRHVGRLVVVEFGTMPRRRGTGIERSAERRSNIDLHPGHETIVAHNEDNQYKKVFRILTIRNLTQKAARRYARQW